MLDREIFSPKNITRQKIKLNSCDVLSLTRNRNLRGTKSARTPVEMETSFPRLLSHFLFLLIHLSNSAILTNRLYYYLFVSSVPCPIFSSSALIEVLLPRNPRRAYVTLPFDFLISVFPLPSLRELLRISSISSFLLQNLCYFSCLLFKLLTTFSWLFFVDQRRRRNIRTNVGVWEQVNRAAMF